MESETTPDMMINLSELTRRYPKLVHMRPEGMASEQGLNWTVDHWSDLCIVMRCDENRIYFRIRSEYVNVPEIQKVILDDDNPIKEENEFLKLILNKFGITEIDYKNRQFKANASDNWIGVHGTNG